MLIMGAIVENYIIFYFDGTIRSGSGLQTTNNVIILKTYYVKGPANTFTLQKTKPLSHKSHKEIKTRISQTLVVNASQPPLKCTG